MNTLLWEKIINFWLVSYKNVSDFARSSPVRDVCVRVGSAERATVGAEEEKRDRTRNVGRTSFQCLSHPFPIEVPLSRHFEYAFLLSVYRNAEEAEMETLKLDGSCEVLNCNLFVVLKLPPGKSD